MKRTTSSDLGKTLVCVIYVIVSFFLLGYALEGKSEKSVYDMGVVWLDTSNYLGDTADYRQWFYAPCECSGIQVAIATDQTEAQNNLVVRIYNASDEEWLGESIVSYKVIKDNQFINIMFEKYTLEEGKLYFFDAYTDGEGENPLHFWVGNSTSEFCLNAEYGGETLYGTSLAFNLLYDYTNMNFVIWMFVTILFLLTIMKMMEEKRNVGKGFGENGREGD